MLLDTPESFAFTSSLIQDYDEASARGDVPVCEIICDINAMWA